VLQSKSPPFFLQSLWKRIIDRDPFDRALPSRSCRPWRSATSAKPFVAGRSGDLCDLKAGVRNEPLGCAGRIVFPLRGCAAWKPPRAPPKHLCRGLCRGSFRRTKSWAASGRRKRRTLRGYLICSCQSNGIWYPLARRLVSFAMPITARSSPNASSVIPAFCAALVCEWIQ
jgi:hypothetical protein